MSLLQTLRLGYCPPLPTILQDPTLVHFRSAARPAAQGAPQIAALFPNLPAHAVMVGERGTARSVPPMRVGVVLSGGQAPGGHNVLTGLFDALRRLSGASHLFGFLNGPDGILHGHVKELTAASLAPYRNQGGFDAIGSGRTKIETSEQLSACLQTAQRLALDGIVVIGGDDSNTTAAILAEHFLAHQCKTVVIGVPKTIDGDLRNDYVPIPFGFDTACKIYSEMIGNIAKDALSAKKYTHFIKLMGRSASHITLECALSTHPNLALIGEEVAHEKQTLAGIVGAICDLICLRAERGRAYGIILIPEGLFEFIPEVSTLIAELNLLLADRSASSSAAIGAQLSEPSRLCLAAMPPTIQTQLLSERDAHGNVQLSLIETERLLIQMVQQELALRKQQNRYRGKCNAVGHFFGYEGRSGFPSNFDANYCTCLGHVAALAIAHGLTGYMCFVGNLTESVAHWSVGAVPLVSLMHLEMRKGKEKPVIRKALVDLNGRAFRAFAQQRQSWAAEDAYRFPGPVQFFGDSALTEALPLTLSS